MKTSQKIWIYIGIIVGAFFISFAYGHLLGSFGIFGGINPPAELGRLTHGKR